MATSDVASVPTSLGRLHVETVGSGPPAVLWHSLFVDSRSWGPSAEALSAHRRVIMIDGPAHGRSEHVDHDFTMDDCATAAVETLDALGIGDSVDWVGNAWGGHVGIVLAARRPDRVRTLTTIGTPVHALTRRERLTKVAPLVQLYRAVGANGIVSKALADALLGADAIAAQPARAQEVMNTFRAAHRPSLLHAMKSVMLERRDLGDLLPTITTPTLMVTAADDAMGWQLKDVRSVTDVMPNAHAGAVRGTGHISPLLLDPDVLTAMILEFWNR